MNFSKILSGYAPYEELLDSIDKSPVSVAGVTEAAQGHIISSLCEKTKTNALVITYSDMEARTLAEDFALYFDNVFHFPERDNILYNIETSDHSRSNTRMRILEKLVRGDRSIVTISVNALMQYCASKERFIEFSKNLKTGESYNIEEILNKLSVMGYICEDMVEGVGQYSVRGEIIDIFSPNYDSPIRIDFFDNEIETIKLFDPLTQRSIESLDKVKIISVSEAIMPESVKDEIIKKLLDEARASESEELKSSIEADIESFNERYYFPSIDKYAEEIYGYIPTISEYLNDDDLIFIIDPKRVQERFKSFDTEKGEIITELKLKNMLSKVGGGFYVSYPEIFKRINEKRIICLDALTHAKTEFKYRALITFTTKTAISFHGKVDYLYDDLKHYAEKNTTVVILVSTRGRGENLEGVLQDKGFRAKYIHLDREFEEGQINIMHGTHSRGFEYPELNFVLICDSEIFATRRRKRSKRRDSANRLKSYNDITAGDYVVHEAHGIGQYMGTQKMTVAGVTKDYLKIQYRGTDVLYVPVDQLSVLYKYVGDTERELKLNKLGGQEWNKTKQRVKASTAEMAKQLVKLYAARESIKGHSYSDDTPWQRDFEDAFLYQETDDQLRSIEEVKADMEKPKPMDRLLCGDVGFGKTEVALRAAFKAVSDSKQVAYFCPTTVLAMQHYETFLKRMKNFPIKVEMLSRFRTPAQIKKIIKRLKTGETDIVIGTHRLLSKDVEFKDLGLLIVDEEQRFGVAHKERLKELKQSVDVLTMTATPIPRTLHMAMTSVRDMSVLTEPPENRYPVQTYVLEENEIVINDAIRNELSRGGQVFYLFNKVSGIYHKADTIKERFPDANVAVGHGKMREEELEDIMCDMVEGRTDILVCTTIIETGLDIPNANTIIIEDADRMGLAQLYQLRGRVGRSNRSAYAYLTYKRDKVLSEVASKRLKAIKEFTEFGSGFKIAMRDLEIRGAGNLLGPEQHGHMDTVGYDMYCKLLKESINEAQNIKETDDINVSVDIEADAYLPDSYIQNSNQRIDIYKRIAGIVSEDDRFEIEEELEDRFGKIPKPVRNIIDVAMLKILAKDAGIYEITQHRDLMQFKFMEGHLSATLIWDIDGKFPSRIKVASAQNPTINFKRISGDPPVIKQITGILSTICELKSMGLKN